MNIVAIGGGELRLKETLPIDRHIVSLTKKRRPRALLIPTASGDSPRYPECFERIYGKILGCRTESLLLLRDAADRRNARRKIREADLIYVGGGNTLRMMMLWRRLGVDDMLRDAARAGTVMSGLSAGAICWFEWGDSDSRRSSAEGHWDYIRVRGLGLCPGIFCPHLGSERRHAAFKRMVARTKLPGLACDDNAAIWYHKDGATCLNSRIGAMAHLYRTQDGKVGIERFGNGEAIPVTGHSEA